MGDFSHNAYRFIEFLAASGQTIWQVLPLGPTHADGSPYQCLSTHAGNPLLISLDWLIDKGWLEADIWQHAEQTVTWRLAVLERACNTAIDGLDTQTQKSFSRFVKEQGFWLEDYARYMVLKAQQGGKAWMDWPTSLRRNIKADVDQALSASMRTLQIRKFEQYLFFTQWQQLRNYAHEHGIYLFGDLPIFVSGDSADVWANREYFTVDENGRSDVVAGVPPDAFTDEGQRWGNPLYDWSALKADGFSWWLDRLRTHFSLFDFVRIDHFRGLESYWEIPAASPTAIEGRWIKAPGAELLKAVYDELGEVALVAEDLGIITAAVDKLREQFSLPGMKVLQFAFDGDPNNHHLPHNHSRDMVAYTGTHDNDTTASWYNSADEETQCRVRSYFQCAHEELPWPMIRSAMMSVARTSIVPMQDVLALGQGHRMNTPGTIEGNWTWRFNWSQVDSNLAGRLRELTVSYGRLPEAEMMAIDDC